MTVFRWMAIAGVMGLATSGCSFSNSAMSKYQSSQNSSDSSESSSDSSESSSHASSESSGGEEKAAPADTAYRDDVRAQTIAFVGSGESVEAFQASVGDVARRYGIVDWEASRATYVGIGQGLAAAKVGGERLATLESELVGSDPDRRSALRQGYDAGSR
jgi:hypothetical protein